MDLSIVKKEIVVKEEPNNESTKKGSSSVCADLDPVAINHAKPKVISALNSKEQDSRPSKSSKNHSTVNLYLTKNSGQYFSARRVSIVPFICEECGADFESISSLVLHFRSHFNGSLHECSVCRTPFSSSLALKKHMGLHSSLECKALSKSGSKVDSSNGMGSCDEEGEDSEGKERDVVQESFRCEYCRECFESRACLEAHVKEHQNQELYTCRECGRRYQHEYLLENHVKMHHVDLWACEECGKTFENKKRLTVHYESHSGIEVEKRHKCKECGKAFVARSKLLRHMRVHTGERPFQCDICGRGFNDRSNLFIHARVHTGEKPYKCLLCGKSFTGKNDLNRHEMIHSGTKPHTCKQCGKSFREKSKLTRHVKTHSLPLSMQKAHKCPTCGKGFREKAKLRRHSKIHERG